MLTNLKTGKQDLMKVFSGFFDDEIVSGRQRRLPDFELQSQVRVKKKEI